MSREKKEDTMSDNGPNPYVVNIQEATLQNNNFRTTLWTGQHLQLTVMSVEPGEDIGLEVHTDHDQFLRIEQGEALVKMGETQHDLSEWNAHNDDAIFIPAGSWHDVINVGTTPLKVYSIYAAPEHAHGTVHVTKQEAGE